MLKSIFLLELVLMVCGHQHPGKVTKTDRIKRDATSVNLIHLQEPSGVISSPGFTEGVDYPINIDTIWMLHVPTDSSYKVVLNITFLEIEREQHCGWDFLAFGKKYKHKICGVNTGVYTIDDVFSETKFRFYSDFYFTQRGFTATYSTERLPNPCDKSPCINESPCHRISSTQYRCECSKHYKGRNCQDFQKLPCKTYPCLILEDNFDYLNPELWQHEITLGGGGNWEFQHYTNNRSNTYCKDGQLFIKPTLTSDAFGEEFLTTGTLDVWGMGPHSTCTGNAFFGCKREGTPANVINPIQSARLRSSRGLNLKFGKVEIKAKLPVGDWIWPAIWMMPTYTEYGGGWPSSGEIDIMESRGNVDYKDPEGEPVGVDHVGSTLHFGPNYKNNAYMKATAAKRLMNGTFADRFYRYGLEWTEDYLRFTIDDEETLKVAPGEGGFWRFGEFEDLNMENPWRYGTKMAPFDEEFYLILNVAVGGYSYFPERFSGPRRKPWTGANKTQFWQAKNEWYPTWNPFERNGEDAALKIDYVKVWKLHD